MPVDLGAMKHQQSVVDLSNTHPYLLCRQRKIVSMSTRLTEATALAGELDKNLDEIV
jgi:hypothetical protein